MCLRDCARSFSLAYSCLNKYREARDAYKKALELDPNNEGFKNNLAIAEEKIRSGSPEQGLPGGMPGLGGGKRCMWKSSVASLCRLSALAPFGFDLGGILNNPAIMNFASQVMSDPAMQNM